jgi:ubiquinone biosynthesis protein
MEFLDGLKPNSAEAKALPEEQKDKLIDLGATAIIRMLYKDGFFHADLHPGNLIILPRAKVGFIDLGMVGRFTEELRRTLMYYYFCLVTGDSENAARYLAMTAQPGHKGNPAGFRREVEEICSRWANSNRGVPDRAADSPVGAGRATTCTSGRDVLIVKALVTFEGWATCSSPDSTSRPSRSGTCRRSSCRSSRRCASPRRASATRPS